ncbi:receptor-like protein EIX2 [Rutidosis leptorrhynchoides]|uniref:receptor-like protein EIX2 n=1 Tax=Rutidosis leptorrhynchoides TaxID=125765 RepID=UPI003A994465
MVIEDKPKYVRLPSPHSNVITVYIGLICYPQYDYDDGRDTSFKVVRIEAVNSVSVRHALIRDIEIGNSINLVSAIPRRNYAETRCIERDRRALLQFKKGLTDDYGLLKSWRDTNASRDCCQWRGVSCRNGTGEVIKLVLPGICSEENGSFLGLKGEISSSFLSLSSLRYLDLSGNSFTRIPEFIGSFKNLQHLKLVNTDFDSPKVPSQLGNLSNLQTLDLVHSSVSIMNTDWISRLSSLKYLNLSYTDLSESVNLLDNAIILPTLAELHLINCYLPNNTAKSFVSTVTNLSNSFVVLDLTSNNLPSSTIYTWLFNFSGSLTDINLSYNELLGTIPEAFGTVQNLQTLDLTENGLEGGIPSSFRNLRFFTRFKFTALKELYLGLNQLNGSFPDKFDQTSNLAILDIADNRINGFLPDLSSFASLRELYFERNLLNETLGENLGPLSKLESLGASSNFFHGTITESQVTNLTHLIYLDLAYNSLVIDFDPEWSPPFQLETISLSSCKLGSSFPGWLKNQNNFSILDISDTGIIDSIPTWFWESLNSVGISYLNLSLNQISGEVSNIIMENLPNMILENQPMIDMSSNNFTGNIPLFPLDTVTLILSDNMFTGSISSLCNLTILNRLDLSNNQLFGNLPNCWKNFDRMTVLNLEFNQFTGSIPESMGSLVPISMISLRGSSLSGELPLLLKNWTMLQLLDLGENQLSGTIPGWVGETLSMLIVLSLPSNRFNGTIPTSLCKLQNIQILDLSVNNFSGTIPKCLNNISAMTLKENLNQDVSLWYNVIGLSESRLTFRSRYVFKVLLQWKGKETTYQKTLGLVVSLDLSSNRLIGEIPGEIMSLLSLIALNLSRNGLTGPIPKDIGQLRWLDFLDLSRNNLIGVIPTSLSQLSNLGVLDLSSNNLAGRIPRSTQLQSFNAASYIGNPALCGLPLPNECPGDEATSSKPRDEGIVEQEYEDKLISKGFFVSIAVGFAFGVLGFYGSLALIDSWRYAFFGFFTVVGNWVLVTIEIIFIKIQRRALLDY